MVCANLMGYIESMPYRSHRDFKTPPGEVDALAVYGLSEAYLHVFQQVVVFLQNR